MVKIKSRKSGIILLFILLCSAFFVMLCQNVGARAETSVPSDFFFQDGGNGTINGKWVVNSSNNLDFAKTEAKTSGYLPTKFGDSKKEQSFVLRFDMKFAGDWAGITLGNSSTDMQGIGQIFRVKSDGTAVFGASQSLGFGVSAPTHPAHFPFNSGGWNTYIIQVNEQNDATFIINDKTLDANAGAGTNAAVNITRQDFFVLMADNGNTSFKNIVFVQNNATKEYFVSSENAPITTDFFSQPHNNNGASMWSTDIYGNLNSTTENKKSNVATNFGGLVGSNIWNELELIFEFKASTDVSGSWLVLNFASNAPTATDSGEWIYFGGGNYFTGSAITAISNHKLNDYNTVKAVISGDVVTISYNSLHITTLNISAIKAGGFMLLNTDNTQVKIRNLVATKGDVVKKYFTDIRTMNMDTEVTQPKTYYISSSGDNSNDGLTDNTAWADFTKINGKVLKAGEKVLLKRGSIWQGKRLEIFSAGKKDSWVEVDAYGDESLAKPIISMANGKGDIAVLVGDLINSSIADNAIYGYKVPITYLKIRNLSIRNTRLGIYVRAAITADGGDDNKNKNNNIVIENCDFSNINHKPVINTINSAADKNAEISVQLSKVKGNLPIFNGAYVASGGGAQEYVFPAAIMFGGIKGNVSDKTKAAAFENITIKDIDISDAACGIIMWFYFNGNGSSGANRNVIKNVNIEDVVVSGVINGAIAFDGVNGGSADADNVTGTVLPTTAGDNSWGLIQNLRLVDGSSDIEMKFPNGTSGAILNNTTNFLINKSEFAGVNNHGVSDGCGIDFETYCSDIEVRNTVIRDNQGSAILIMDSTNGSTNNGGHNNLYFNNNLIYNNSVSQTREQKAFSFYASSKSKHKQVYFRNNFIYFPTKNIDGKVMTLGDVSVFDNTVAFAGSKIVFDSSNQIFYTGEKNGTNGTYDSYAMKEVVTGFADALVAGTIEQSCAINGNLYKGLYIKSGTGVALSGTIKITMLDKTSQTEQFSTANGFVDLDTLFGDFISGGIKNIVITTTDLTTENCEFQFIPNVSLKVSAASVKTLSIVLEGSSNINFKHDVVAADIVMKNNQGETLTATGIKKVGINKLELTFENGLPMQADTVNLSVAVKSTAFNRPYNFIFENKNPDTSKTTIVNGYYQSSSIANMYFATMETKPTITYISESNIVYGTALSEGVIINSDGVVKSNDTIISGTFAFKMPNEVPNVTADGIYKAAVLFTPSIEFETVCQTIEFMIDIKVVAKKLAVEWGNAQFIYNGSNQVPTATVVTGVGSETLGLTVTGAKTEVGEYAATATLTTTNLNYILTNDTKAYKIIKDTTPPKTDDELTPSVVAGCSSATAAGKLNVISLAVIILAVVICIKINKSKRKLRKKM